MKIDLEGPAVRTSQRVLILGAATRGWYEADDQDRRTRILPRFQAMMDEWRELGARVLATLDDDLFMVGPPGSAGFTWYLIVEVDSLDTLAAMTQRVRETIDGVRMDRYVRFQARIGRPFSLLEPSAVQSDREALAEDVEEIAEEAEAAARWGDQEATTRLYRKLDATR